MTLEKINTWHQRARPKPTIINFNVQLGCHLEEVVEMLESLTFSDERRSRTPGDSMVAHLYLKNMADRLKSGELIAMIEDRKALLDSLADQIVTAVGSGHCAKMDVVTACKRVDDSNWSKYDEQGQPIFKDTGKIAKGPNYVEPDLEGLY